MADAEVATPAATDSAAQSSTVADSGSETAAPPPAADEPASSATVNGVPEPVPTVAVEAVAAEPPAEGTAPPSKSVDGPSMTSAVPRIDVHGESDESTKLHDEAAERVAAALKSARFQVIH